ncbi:MAG: DUF6503 family protein [Bacteroidota bacterium]
MKFNLLYLLTITLLLTSCQPPAPAPEAETIEEAVTENLSPEMQLVNEFTAAMGGMDTYRQLKSVTYDYSNKADGQTTVLSKELYLYPSEWSWASYPAAANPTDKEEKGELTQAYVDDGVWVTFNGELVKDSTALKRARFSRKTNFYWLNMFFKMQDPGLTYELAEDRIVDGQNYQTLKVSFEDNIGDAKDIYFLYINKETKLVDYFLFTVMEFDRSEPIMMKVKYEEVGGLMWPTYRASTTSNWAGEVAEDAKWSEKYMLNLEVNGGYDKALFLKE